MSGTIVESRSATSARRRPGRRARMRASSLAAAFAMYRASSRGASCTALTALTLDPGRHHGVVNDLAALFARVPEGWSQVDYDGRRWGVPRTVHGDGRSESILAEELGGTDLVSANLYRLTDNAVLKPCEMASEKVLDFLEGLVPARGA